MTGDFIDLILGCAQGNVKDGTVLCDVDLLACEHGLDRWLETGGISKGGQQLQGFVVDAVLAVVQQDALGRKRHALAARWVLREHVLECCGSNLRVVGLERLPSGVALRCGIGCSHANPLSFVWRDTELGDA